MTRGSDTDKFRIVGIRHTESAAENAAHAGLKHRMHLSPAALILAVIVLGCVFCELIMTKDPTYMELAAANTAPCREYLFGTDAMGRDIFSMIWYGGRVSLFIGAVSTLITTFIAVVYGTLSGIAPKAVDEAMMRLLEIMLSIPSLPLTVLLQAVIGEPNVLSISAVIGMTGWMSIASVVRTEVKQLRNNEYVIAAKSMGGGFFYILRRHLAPNFAASVMFMVVMNVRSAIAAESTMSFMGIGLPLEIISWGSMLSLAEKALLTDAWWVILIPGAFIAATMLSITSIGDSLRRDMSRKHSNI